MKHTRKAISLLLAVLMLAGIFTAVPFTVSAAETGEAVGTTGTTGDCTWSFDDDMMTLTISGSGSTGDYTLGGQPWAKYNERIQYIEVENGVTRLGKFVFSGAQVYQTTLPSSVTEIGFGAFMDCDLLYMASFGTSVAKIGDGAFINTDMRYIEVPNSSCEIGEGAFGFHTSSKGQTVRNDNFMVYGLVGSTAEDYAALWKFDFIDINGRIFPVTVERGHAYNLNTRKTVTEAYEGEPLQAVADLEKYELLDYFYGHNDTIDLDEDWCFLMPSEDAVIHAVTHKATPVEYDLRSYDTTINESDYELISWLVENKYLTTAESAVPGFYVIDLDHDGSDDISVSPQIINVLTTNSVKTSASVCPKNCDYSPITFLFAEPIRTVNVTVNVPCVGDPWNYYTMFADVDLENPDDPCYIIREPEKAIWYDPYTSTFKTFENGKSYDAMFTIVPYEGYAFAMDTVFYFNGDLDNPVLAYEMYSDGSLGVYTPMYKLVSNGITANNCIITPDPKDYFGKKAVTSGTAGQRLFVLPDFNNIEDNQFVVLFTDRDIEAEGVSVITESTPEFTMPENAVTITMNPYVVLEQKDSVLDFTDVDTVDMKTGLYGDLDIPLPAHEACGVMEVLRLAAVCISDAEGTQLGYDIDSDGTPDIKYEQYGKGDNAGVKFTIINKDKLKAKHASGRVTLELDRIQSVHSPSRTLTIVFDNTVKAYKVNVTGGHVSPVRHDHYGDRKVTEAYPGQHLYLNYSVEDMGDDGFYVQGTANAVSDTFDEFSYITTVPEFDMPAHDLDITFSYELGHQRVAVFDFYNGPVTLEDSEEFIGNDEHSYARSIPYGGYAVLYHNVKAAKQIYTPVDEYTSRNTKDWWDMDGDGTYDIEYEFDSRTYTLLPDNSLDDVDSMEFTLSRDESLTLPCRTAVLQFKKPAPKHQINIINGVALIDDKVVTEAAEGQIVHICYDTEDLGDRGYYVQFSASAESDDIDDFYYVTSLPDFVMPDHDVTATLFYELAQQIDYSLDLSDGTATAPYDRELYGEGNQKSPAYGAYIVLMLKSANYDYVSTESFMHKYDVDGDGTFDIVEQSSTDEGLTFAKLPSCSLKGVVTLTLDREECYTVPVRTLKLIFEKPKKIKGDINRDGKVDVVDATFIQKHCAGFRNADNTPLINEDDEEDMFLADVDGDGKITVVDATNIQRIAVGLPIIKAS